MTETEWPDEASTNRLERFELHEQISQFLEKCREPAVVEAGEPILPLREGEYSLEASRGGCLLEVWANNKILRRRVTRVSRALRDRLELVTEQFPRKTGKLTLIDERSLSAPVMERDSARAEDLARLRVWSERLFPRWRIEQISCGTDLEHSLSPRFPRAFLRSGATAMALLAAPCPESADDALAFALVWLQYAQARWPALHVASLGLFVPASSAVAMGLRLRALDAGCVRFRLFAFGPDEFLEERPPQSWGNLDSSLPWQGSYVAPDEKVRATFCEVAAQSEAEVVEDLHGGLHLEVRGLPIAICRGDRVQVGLALRQARRKVTVSALLPVARQVAQIRCANSVQPNHELYRSYPERWLEGVVRNGIRKIDPLIDPLSVRRQVTGFLGLHHTRTDLLALDRNGNLVIVEVKAAEDISLPIQALDYYTRLRLHIDRGQIQASSLYPNRVVRNVPPRLLLVAPALHFHPTNETVLRFFESSISARQIGLAIEWRRKLRVVFDHPSGARKSGGNSEWQAISSIKSGRPFPH